jgi:Flp pilus assembly protein TadG
MILSKLQKFKKNLKAAVAVEFALVALPFFTLLIGTFEVALFYFTDLNLSYAVHKANRQIFTCNFGSQTRDNFIILVCGNAFIPNCTSSVKVQITRLGDYTTFDNSTNTNQTQCYNSAKDSDFAFDPALSEQVNITTVCMQYKIFTPLIGKMLVSPTAYTVNGTKQTGDNTLIINYVDIVNVEPC